MENVSFVDLSDAIFCHIALLCRFRSCTELDFILCRSFILKICVFFTFFDWHFYRHRVIFIVYRFIVLSFYLDLYTNFFSLFVPFSVFFERCGGKLSVNRFYFTKIDISAAM